MRKGRYAICALLSLLLLVCSGAGTAAQEKKSAAEYDFGPVSYDLKKLPPMENKIYASWDGKIYFRQYSDEDLEDGGLWAEFDPVADTEKALMCMDSDGSVKQVGTDYGCETMFIADGRIYSQRYSEDADYGGYQVYSCRLDGSDVKYYRFERVLAVKGSKVICRYARGDYALGYIDTQTGREQILTSVRTYYSYLGATEEEIFYEDSWTEEETGAEGVTLYSVDYAGNISQLWTLDREGYLEIMDCDAFLYQTPLSIEYFKIAGDRLCFSAGSRNGNAHMYSGGPIYSMKKDGSGCKLAAISWEPYFYLYDDGKNCGIYFRGSDERYGKSVGDEAYMRQVTLRGKMPQDIVPRQPYMSFDEFYVNVNENDSIVFYPDTSGVCYVLLTEEEAKSLSVMTHRSGRIYQTIEDIEYIDGKLFFTVFDLTYNGDKSIGWRDYYDRGRSACYCKDLKTGDICLLYEYAE